MFNFRFGGQGGTSPMQPPTIETVRRRARHRLLGASVLVLAGVIGFPLLFESQPRPVPVDFEIDIPARNAAKSRADAHDAAPQPGVRLDGLDESEELVSSSVQVPAQAAPVPAPAPAVVIPPPPAPALKPVSKLAEPAVQAVAPAQQPPVAKPWDKRPAVIDKPQAEAKPAAERKPAEPKPADKPVERKPVEPKVAAKTSDDAIRAMSLLEGKPLAKDKPVDDDKSATKSRHVVQVGAFVDPALAQEARMKLERVGLTTYTQLSNTPDGPRTRVRLGPFATRAEADKAAAKARTLGLSASILAL